MSKHIFWIASYPKSGNTLLRSIISSLFFSSDGKFNFNLLKKIVSFEEIVRLRNVKNLQPCFLKNIDTQDRNTLIYENMIELQKKSNLGFNEDFAFFKTHFCAQNFDGRNFIINENVRGIFYVVRDPRDVCLSWSKHADINIEKSSDFMVKNDSIIKWSGFENDPEYPRNTPVYISSWDEHVKSWVRNLPNIPHLILKFEDIVYNKKEVIETIIIFFEKNYKIKVSNREEKIKNILQTTDFLSMQTEEINKGFKESVGKQFFSVGKKNQWKHKLDKKNIIKLENKFGITMKKFNYELGVEI